MEETALNQWHEWLRRKVLRHISAAGVVVHVPSFQVPTGNGFSALPFAFMVTLLSPLTVALVKESRDHLTRLRDLLDGSRSQAQLVMSLLQEARQYLKRIEAVQAADGLPAKLAGSKSTDNLD